MGKVDKRESKRADLRQRLISAATVELEEKGLKGLKAREITQRAGCALGALYNVAEDLDMLILMVNTTTLSDLGETLRASVTPPLETPETTLQALAKAYIDFSVANQNRWLALFEHRLAQDTEMPDWHKSNHAILIDVIAPPLKALRPDLEQEQLALRARTIFAAVHGVVHLSLQGQFVGVPIEDLRQEVESLVSTMTRGSSLQARQG